MVTVHLYLHDLQLFRSLLITTWKKPDVKLAEHLIINDSLKSNLSCFSVQDPKANPWRNAILMPDISTWEKQHAFITLAFMFSVMKLKLKLLILIHVCKFWLPQAIIMEHSIPPLWVASVILFRVSQFKTQHWYHKQYLNSSFPTNKFHTYKALLHCSD